MTDLDVGQIRSLLAPVLADGDIVSVSRANGGLINTVYRVVPDGTHGALGVRIYADGMEAVERLLAGDAGAVLSRIAGLASRNSG